MSGIKTTFSVDNKNFKKGMKDAQNTAQKSLKKIEGIAKDTQHGFKGILSILGKLGPVGKGVAIAIGAIGAAVYGAIKMVNNLADKINNITKSAKNVNLTTTVYQDMSYAAKESGVAMEQVIRILQTLNQKFSEAAKGSEEIINAFAEIGLSWSELQKLSPDKQLRTVLETVNALSKTQRDKYLIKLFNTKQIETIKKMIANDFGKSMASAKIMGVTIDEESIQLADQYNNTLDKSNQRLIAMASNLQATKSAMEVIKKFADEFTKNMNFDTRITSSYADEFYAIGDAVEQVKEKLKAEGKQGVIKALNKWVEDQLQKELDLIYKTGNSISNEAIAKKRQEYTIEAWKTQLNRYDSRFNTKDRSTWVQRRNQNNTSNSARDPQKIKQDLINGAIKRRSAELQAITKKYKDNINALSKQLDLQKQIERIEKKYGGKLKDEDKQKLSDDMLQAQIARNQLILATIQKENDSLRNQFQIQKALLQGDSKRVEVLKAIAKLRQQGLNVTEDDFKNVEDKYQQTVGDIKTNQEWMKDNPEYQQRQKFQAELIKQQKQLQIQKAQLKGNETNYKSGNISFGEYSGQKVKYEGNIDQTEATIKNLKNKIQEIQSIKMKESDESYLKYYQRIMRQTTGLQNEKKRLQIIKQLKKQFEQAAEQKTQLDNLSIENMINDSKKQTELQIAQINGDQQQIRMLQTINQLKQAGIIKDQNDIQRIKLQYQELLKQKKLNQQLIDEAKVKKMTSDTQNQNDILYSQFDRDWEQVNTLKLINQLKAQGIQIDKKSFEINRKKYQGLINEQEINKALILKKSQQDEVYPMLYQAMQQAGFGKQASRMQALRNAETRKGDYLTKDEQKITTQMADLQYKLSRMGNERPNLSNYEIKSNQLTARGGFAGGAVVSKQQTVNNQIRNYNQQQVTILKQIKELIRDGGF